MSFSLHSHYCETKHAEHRFVSTQHVHQHIHKNTLFVFQNKKAQHAFLHEQPQSLTSTSSALIMQPLHSRPQPNKTIWVHNQYSSEKRFPIRQLEANRSYSADIDGEWYRDMWFHPNYTFGLEIELTSSDFVSSAHWKKRYWKERAQALIDLLSLFLSTNQVVQRPCVDVDSSYSKWQVIYDQSTGWEIVSPILQGIHGVQQVLKVMNGLQRLSTLGLQSSHNTGCHLHLGWDFNLSTLKRLLNWYFFFEPSLGTMVHPQRLSALHLGYFSKTKINPHCIPISQNMSGSSLKNSKTIRQVCMELPRNSSLNLQSIQQKGTIEFRMLEATRDPQVLLLWVSICHQLLALSEMGRIYAPIPEDWESSPIDPSGDMYALSKAFLPGGKNMGFLQTINNRRVQVAAHWFRNRTLHPWLKYIQQWNIN